MPRGHCTLPAEETGRIGDRLEGLEQVIRPEDVRPARAATGRVETRGCVLTDEVIFGVVRARGLLTDLPIRPVFKQARRRREGEESPARSHRCMARRRLGVMPVRHLFSQVVRPLAGPDTPGAFDHGLRWRGIDGVVRDVPDSAANAAAFGRPAAGPRGDGAFPQVKTLRLVEWGTHVEVACVVRPRRGDERAMVAGLLPHLTPAMLLVWERAFSSDERWRRWQARGVKPRARVDTSMILRPIRGLADGSYLAKVDQSPSDREKDHDGVIVRVIRYTRDDPRRAGHGEVHVLITNLVDEAIYTANELIIRLYWK